VAGFAFPPRRGAPNIPSSRQAREGSTAAHDSLRVIKGRSRHRLSALLVLCRRPDYPVAQAWGSMASRRRVAEQAESQAPVSHDREAGERMAIQGRRGRVILGAWPCSNQAPRRPPPAPARRARDKTKRASGPRIAWPTKAESRIRERPPRHWAPCGREHDAGPLAESQSARPPRRCTVFLAHRERAPHAPHDAGRQRGISGMVIATMTLKTAGCRNTRDHRPGRG